MVRRCKHRRRAVALGFGVVFAGSHYRCAGTGQQESERARKLEEVIVTGSRIARDGFDASTPVAVIDADDIKLSGTANVERLLSEPPQFVASTNGGASNTVPGGTADVNLRGFGASRNLVLVNGRRFAIYGPEQTTDLNTIPTALIERTEIVTGGSSAVYGSDAITGVVNFIMRDDFEGVEAHGADQFRQPDHHADLQHRPHRRRQFRRRPRQRRRVGQLSQSRRHHSRRARRMGVRLAVRRLRRHRPHSAAIVQACRVGGASGSTCRAAGGVPGLIAGGSGDIPNGRFSGVPIRARPHRIPA